jgi:hypothetical protein
MFIAALTVFLDTVATVAVVVACFVCGFRL